MDQTFKKGCSNSRWRMIIDYIPVQLMNLNNLAWCWFHLHTFLCYFFWHRPVVFFLFLQIDFGASMKEESLWRRIVGTYGYTTPPQMLSGDLYSFEADFWAFGTLTYSMLTGRWVKSVKCNKWIQTIYHVLLQLVKIFLILRPLWLL